MIQTYLPILDGRCEGWQDQLERQLQLGSNFLFVLPKDANPAKTLEEILGAPTQDLSKTLTQVDLLSFCRYIHPKAMEILKSAREAGHELLFLQQIKILPFRSTGFSPFILYCDMRGVVSQHNSLAEAREACTEYFYSAIESGEYPEIRVYQRMISSAGDTKWIKAYEPHPDFWSPTDDLNRVQSSKIATAAA